MLDKKYFYLIELQYLGFRLHGFQHQPTVKTIQGILNKTLKYVLPDKYSKTLGSSRTDAKVSANQSYFELFVHEPVPDDFLETFNLNLPGDVRILSVKEVDDKFNVIQHPKVKEYNYLFSHGEKAHPFGASLVTSIIEPLDIELMKKAAKLFEGTHSFHSYVSGASDKKVLVRTVDLSEIVINDIYTANFFPKNTFLYRVKGEGFLRYQVRLMMGTLIRVGNGQLEIESIQKSLDDLEYRVVPFIAPASGLILQSVEMKGI
jgi:tRNA pseudouridine38-40 synthase